VLITYSYYAAVDPDNPAAITVERQTEYVVCTDPDDPGGNEVGRPIATPPSRAASSASRRPPMPPCRPPRII
jgi:hypothetical protein